MNDALGDDPKHLGRLIFEIFRLNGRLLAAGDALVGELGLTSARWQVLWAIAIAEVPQPVAHLARAMGLNRQGVQRIVNELEAEGLIAFRDNPNHLRAKLVELTGKGRETYAAAARLRQPWLAGLADGLTAAEVDAALRAISVLRRRLE
ncbi:MAG: MarR family transcriptional regulator [Devosia sp.]|nr:MarR family transcriptional regulator [Devosia sp.]